MWVEKSGDWLNELAPVFTVDTIGPTRNKIFTKTISYIYKKMYILHLVFVSFFVRIEIRAWQKVCSVAFVLPLTETRQNKSNQTDGANEINVHSCFHVRILNVYLSGPREDTSTTSEFIRVMHEPLPEAFQFSQRPICPVSSTRTSSAPTVKERLPEVESGRVSSNWDNRSKVSVRERKEYSG